MDKGRCLRADRDVAPGELLFVTPALAAAPVGAVRRVWLERRRQQQQQNKQQRQHPQSVAEAAERVLLEECRRRVKDDRGVRRALNALEDGRGTMKTTTPLPSMECLLGNDYGGDDDDDAAAFVLDEDDRLLQIIRRNAFGGDFVTAEVVERRWSNVSDEEDRHFRPPRLLGHYPLAAMINHSCVPNAVRVFTVTNSEETMVAHACQRIAKDEEIVWSYIPLTQPFEIRRQRLRELGFVCHCERCEAEMILTTTAGGDGDDAAFGRSSVEELEDWLASKKDDDDHRGGNRVFSNATQRYLRVSYLPLYMEHLNQNANPGNRDRYPELLKLCAQLHFSLAACHNASTEHLSVRADIFAWLFTCCTKHYLCVGLAYTLVDSTHPYKTSSPPVQFCTLQLI